MDVTFGNYYPLLRGIKRPPNYPKKSQGHPIETSIPIFPGEVSIHQMPCQFPSLRMGSLQWVRRKGGRR